MEGGTAAGAGQQVEVASRHWQRRQAAADTQAQLEVPAASLRWDTEAQGAGVTLEGSRRRVA